MKKILLISSLLVLCTACSPSRLTEDKLASGDDSDLILTQDGQVIDEADLKVDEPSSGSSVVIPVELSPEEKLMSMKDEENARLTEKVLEYKKERDTLLLTIEAIERDPISAKDIKDRTAGKEVSFKSCGLKGLFQSRDWFEPLEELMSKRRFRLFGVDNMILVDPETIEAGCYSSVGDIFVFLVGGDEAGRGFGVLRYDVKMDSLQMAEIDAHGKSTIGAPRQFGKREGNSIGLVGNIQDGECQSEMIYDYDFIENEVSLKKSCVRCAGKDEACEEF